MLFLPQDPALDSSNTGLPHMLRSLAFRATVSQTPPNGVPEGLADSLKFVFSWLVLTPIAIIVSGRMLAQRFNLPGTEGQRFGITLPVLRIRAEDDEAILGFTGFILTLLLLGLAVGSESVDSLVRGRFGISPGAFNSLVVVSSFVTVAWSCAVFLLTARGGGSLGDKKREHQQAIEELGHRSTPGVNAND